MSNFYEAGICGVNIHLVGRQGEYIVFLKHQMQLSEDSAINLAAWIVALVDRKKFDKALQEITGE